MFRPSQILTVCAIAAACGGQVDPSSSRGDASFDGAGLDGDAGAWTACISPQGYGICGGPKNCPDSCGGPAGFVSCSYLQLPSGESHAIAYCENRPWVDFLERHMGKSWQGVPTNECNGSCEDGVCVRDQTDRLYCVPYEIGVLYAQSGAADRVRYADFGLWQDKPIPASAGACPTVPGMTLCGPGCGTCAASELCVGRAPLHPTGFCMPRQPDQYHPTSCSGSPVLAGCNAAWSKCFTFTVEPAAQALADEYGYCVPNASCAQLAASLPGGGKCSP